MAIDPSIALQVRPLQFPDPLANATKALSLRQLIFQGRAQEEDYARKNALRNLLAQTGGDLNKAKNALLQMGEVDAAMDIEGKLLGRDKAQREAQAAQFDLLKKQSERTAQLAGSVLLADPMSKPQAYAQARAQAISEGLVQENDPRFPAAYSPQVESVLRQVSEQALSVKDALERQDYAALGQPQAPQALPVQPIAHESGAVTQGADMRVPAGVPISETEQDPVVVTAQRPDFTPDWFRAEAARLERKGTKAALDQAERYRQEANRLDERIWKEREKLKPVSGVPGVTFDESTGSYMMNGEPISAEQVQRIAAEQRRAGATSITVGQMTPENAAKTELLNQGIADMAEFKELVMPGGKVNRQIVAGMAAPGMAGIPGTDSRIAYSLIYNAVEAKLRAESGAAVPQSEVERMASRFIPSPLDSDEAIFSKIRRMEAFLRGSFQRIKGAGQATTPQKPKKGPGSGTREDPYKIKSDDGYNAIKSGEYFIGPDGQLRQKP